MHARVFEQNRTQGSGLKASEVVQAARETRQRKYTPGEDHGLLVGQQSYFANKC